MELQHTVLVEAWGATHDHQSAAEATMWQKYKLDWSSMWSQRWISSTTLLSWTALIESALLAHTSPTSNFICKENYLDSDTSSPTNPLAKDHILYFLLLIKKLSMLFSQSSICLSDKEQLTAKQSFTQKPRLSHKQFQDLCNTTFSVAFLGICQEPGGKRFYQRIRYSGPYHVGSHVIYNCSHTLVCQSHGSWARTAAICTG